MSRHHSIFNTNNKDKPMIYVHEIGRWDVNLSPITKKIVNGQMLPTLHGIATLGGALQVGGKQRRLVVEIHSPTTPQGLKKKDKEREEHRNNRNLHLRLEKEDVVIIRILVKGEDESSDASVKFNVEKHSEEYRPEDSINSDDMLWKERNRMMFRNLRVLKVHGKMMEVKAGAGADAFTREVRFVSQEECAEFNFTLMNLDRMEQERGDRKLDAYRKEHAEDKSLLRAIGEDSKRDTDDDSSVMINLLVEIVSAKNLPATNPDFRERLKVKGGTKPHAQANSPARRAVSTETGHGYERKESPGDTEKNGKGQAPPTPQKKKKVDLYKMIPQRETRTTDVGGFDPYVVALLGNREIHRTSAIKNTSEPIWTLYTNGLFLISMRLEEFFAATAVGGLTFDVRNGSKIMGRVIISTEEMLAATGERVSYEILPPKLGPKLYDKSTRRNNPPNLFVRIRKASRNDISFIQEYEAKYAIHDSTVTVPFVMSKYKQGLLRDETCLPPGNDFHKFWHHLRMDDNVRTHFDERKEKLHRIKPYPDPNRPLKETEWMNEDRINREVMEPSTRWVEAGSGKIGKLHVEILKCDGLQSAKMIKDRPNDTFACIIHEDAVVNTDVLRHCNHPRWMPWCRRAFSFNISHPSSKIYIGLFDYNQELNPVQQAKKGITPGGLHNQIGRVMVNMSRFSPDLVYTLTYDVYEKSSTRFRSKVRGTMTVRIHLVLNDNSRRKTLLYSAMPPPSVEYVSTSRDDDFDCAAVSAGLSREFNSWSLDRFASHVEELQSYIITWDYVKTAAKCVFLWRGSYDLIVFGHVFGIPLHSMVAFVWAILLSRDFNLLFSFVLFSIAWFLLSMNQIVRANPSPWHKCASYQNIFYFLVLGKSVAPPIAPGENEGAFSEYMSNYQNHVEAWEEEQELEEKFSAEFLAEISNEEKVEIATKKRAGLALALQETFGGVNPVRQILHPVQIELGKILVLCRVGKHIVLWRENLYSFWITTIALLSSILVAFLPWAWILRWIFRIVLVGGSGPWNMIWDRLYDFPEKRELTKEEREAMIRERVQKRFQKKFAGAEKRQIDKEKRIKRKAMTSYMYGNKTVRVPHFNEQYYVDIPLTESYAEPYDPIKHGSPIARERRFGQRLTGDMIPKREIQEANATETSESSEPATAYDDIVQELTKRGKVQGELPTFDSLALDALKLMAGPSLDDLKPNTHTKTAMVHLHQQAQAKLAIEAEKGRAAEAAKKDSKKVD